jgi:hypothetical protein
MKHITVAAISVLAVAVVVTGCVYVSDNYLGAGSHDEWPMAAVVSSIVQENDTTIRLTIQLDSRVEFPKVGIWLQFNDGDRGSIARFGSEGKTVVRYGDGLSVSARIIDTNGNRLFESGEDILLISDGAFQPGEYKFTLGRASDGSALAARAFIVT